MDKEPLNRRDWIAGLEKGLAILEAFDNDHPRLTPTQAAQLTGLTRTAARPADALEHLGYTTSDGTLFSLTPRVLKVGWSYFDSARLPRTVQPFLQQITAQLGEAAYLSARWAGAGLHRPHQRQPRDEHRLRAGRAGAGALGSAGVMMMLASRPESGARVAGELRARPYTPYTIMQSDRLLEEIRKAGQRGYAMLEQQLQTGVRGIAVPLRDRHGKVIAALSVNMPIGDETAEQALERVLQVMQDTALLIMRVL